MSLDVKFRKSERNWTTMQESPFVQRSWEPIRSLLLGAPKSFPSIEQITAYKWWPLACMSLFDTRDNRLVKIKSNHQAKNQLETILFIRSLAQETKEEPLYSIYKEGLFDSLLFRLCTTKKPQKLSSALFQMIRERSMDMIRIPQGSYWVGSSKRITSAPYHMVKTNTFSIAVFPVTQLLWYDVMNNSPSKYKGSTRPVEQISWTDAIEFCNQLSLKEDREPYYSTNGKEISTNIKSDGYRLPTEAQWEIAARGEKSFGNAQKELISTWNIEQMGWVSQATGTRPIGQKKQNQFGVQDIFGNVFEWCWDLFGAYQNMIETKGQKKPYFMREEGFLKGPEFGHYRCYRGGAWNLTEEFAKPYQRMAGAVKMKSTSIGMRICCPD
jgi:sulfatase modifying factor 1